jgi:hypothetical protein
MPTHERHLRRLCLLVSLVAAACSPGASSDGTTGAGGTGGAGATGGGSAGGRGGTGAGTGGTSAGSGGTSAGSGGTGAGGSVAGSGGAGGTSAGSGGGGSGGASGGAGGSEGGGTGGSGNGSDAATPDGNAASPDSAPGGTGPLPPAVRKVVILHDAAAGASAGDPSRKSMEDILNSMKESHGVVVEWMDSPTRATELMDKALVIIGPNAKMFGENHPDAGLKTLPVPLMVSKDGNTTEVGLGRVSATDPPEHNKITLVMTDHPLAAGLAAGSITVLTTPNRQRIITFADIGPGAIKIANGPQNASSWAIVGYDKGADMGNGLMAPAKRVGFFWHRPAGTTPDGTKLFKAAVDWLLRP